MHMRLMTQHLHVQPRPLSIFVHPEKCPSMCSTSQPRSSHPLARCHRTWRTVIVQDTRSNRLYRWRERVGAIQPARHTLIHRRLLFWFCGLCGAQRKGGVKLDYARNV
jgi:hypothetical protein